jgi:transposase
MRKEPVVENAITWVGLDAHQATIQVAMLLPGRSEPVQWQVANEPRDVRRMVRKIQRAAPGALRSCYEAGVCGYALQRQLEAAGMTCAVIAPALVPVKRGDRIKTDKRDARKLATLLRAGLLTAVRPPTPAEEAARDLCRAREDGVEDLQRARHRLGKFLLRRGLVWRASTAWSQAHRRWLRDLVFEHDADRAVVADYLLGVEQLEARLETMDAAVTMLAAAAPYRTPVGWLRCFRGIDTLTAMTLVTELHDVRRFTSARALMAYIGLVPSEDSSGERRRRGALTKAGNAHVRRVILEAAWHYRHPPRIGRTLRARREGQPGRVIAVADKALQRLHRRFSRLTARGKTPQKIVVAVGRELVGFVWSALTAGAAA